MLWIRLNALSIIGLRFHGYFIYIAKYQCGMAWTIINFTQTEHIHTATTTNKCEENPPTNFQLLFISVNSTQNRNDCAMNQIVWRNFQFTGKLNQIGGKFFKNCFLIFSFSLHPRQPMNMGKKNMLLLYVSDERGIGSEIFHLWQNKCLKMKIISNIIDTVRRLFFFAPRQICFPIWWTFQFQQNHHEILRSVMMIKWNYFFFLEKFNYRCWSVSTCKYLYFNIRPGRKSNNKCWNTTSNI